MIIPSSSNGNDNKANRSASTNRGSPKNKEKNAHEYPMMSFFNESREHKKSDSIFNKNEFKSSVVKVKNRLT